MRVVVGAVFMSVVLVASTRAGGDAAPPEPRQGPLQTDALKLLERWVQAQNAGDRAAYFALYDQKHFKGVKRTTRGTVKRYDFAGWSVDRGQMFARKPKVAADHPTVETWLDPGSKLKAGVARVRFIQRWKTERYADHGTKILQLWRNPVGGYAIIYEDLVNSFPGWDDLDEDATRLVLTPPRDDQEALALWRKIAPTGADYAKKLGAIPDAAQVTRPLARALLGGGNFECTEVIRASECGEDIVEWADLDPKAGFDQPCLRRKLAVWALASAHLTEADAKRLQAELASLLKLGPPEKELGPAVMKLVDEMSAPLRMSLLRDAPAELAEAHVAGLPEASLVELYRARHLDSAIAGVSVSANRAVVLQAIADGALKAETRSQLMSEVSDLKGADVDQALAAVADGADDCALAEDAAHLLAARGDRRHLPRWRKDATPQELGRALCMLVHEPDGAEQLTRYKEFLPPRGKVKITEEFVNEFAERDEDGVRKDESPPDESFTRKSVDAFNVDRELGAGTLKCSDDSCQVDTTSGNYTVSFALKGGRYYLAELHRYRWRGCPC